MGSSLATELMFRSELKLKRLAFQSCGLNYLENYMNDYHTPKYLF